MGWCLRRWQAKVAPTQVGGQFSEYGDLDRSDSHAPLFKPDFLFPVRTLSGVFRGKFMAALAAARHEGGIERDPQGPDAAWQERQRQLYKHHWVVYAKTPLGGLAQVLAYLSRFTHSKAIGNERIKAVTEREVVLSACR